MHKNNTFTFKRLVGGRYVTEEVNQNIYDDTFQFTVLNNKKKPKLIDESTFSTKPILQNTFEFEIIKEKKKKGRKPKNKPGLTEIIPNLDVNKIEKNKESLVEENNLVKVNPLQLYKSINGPFRFKELLNQVTLFLKNSEFKKNLPKFCENVKICSDLKNLKKEINFLDVEIEKWHKIKEEKIKSINKIEVKKEKIGYPITLTEPSKVLEEGKRVLLNLLIYLEKKIEKINHTADQLIIKNLKPKTNNCTIILRQLSKLE